MGSHSQFTSFLPLCNLPWLPESLVKERQEIRQAQEDLIARRYEAVSDAIRDRPHGEETSDPVRISSPSLLTQEIHVRRSVEEFVRKALEAARAYLDELPAELERAEETAKDRLRDAGYVDPVDGRDVSGSFTPKMVRRHPEVQAVLRERVAAEVFIAKHEAIRRDNLRWAEELTAKLGRVRAAVPVAAM